MDTSSAENLKRVAQQLVQAREAQGISLEEIATKTFIPMRILKALEAGETFKLPEPIFVQGFIKRYAKLVGLDGDTLAKEIPLNTQPVAVDLIKEVPRPPLVDVINKRVSLDSVGTEPNRSLVNPVQSQRSVESDRNGGSEPTAKTPATVFNPPVRDTPDFYASQGNPSTRPTWLWPAIGGAVLGFGFLMGAIALIKGTQTAEPPATPKPSAPIVTQSTPSKPSPVASPVSVPPSPIASPSPSPSASPSPSPTQSPSAGPSPSPSPSPTSATGPVSVAVSLNEASWVQVTVDGEVKFEGTLEKGAKQSWAGQKEVEISSGNAGAVMVVHNQTPAKAMGAAGQVETKKFSTKN